MSSELAAWYKNRPIVLWVEDPLTRTYLRALWRDTQISYLVAGGNDAVVGAVHDARRDGYANVFGLRDRDFLTSNIADWANPNKSPTVFRPPRHEVENYLLRSDLLASLGPDLNPRRRSQAELEALALQRATESLWWMICRAVIHDARLAVNHEFPAHPEWGERAEVSDAATTRARLLQQLVCSAWATSAQGAITGLGGPWIDERVTFHHDRYQAALDDGSWAELWSGKDIFKELAGHVYVGAKKAVAATELAKALGALQHAEGRTGDLWDLHSSLYQRVGLSPATAAAAP